MILSALILSTVIRVPVPIPTVARLLHAVVKPLHWLGLSIISCGVLMVGNTVARTSAIDSKRQLLFRVILRATTGNTPDSKGLN